jgi:hypothetical protein
VRALRSRASGRRRRCIGRSFGRQILRRWLGRMRLRCFLVLGGCSLLIRGVDQGVVTLLLSAHGEGLGLVEYPDLQPSSRSALLPAS